MFDYLFFKFGISSNFLIDYRMIFIKLLIHTSIWIEVIYVNLSNIFCL